MTARPARVSPGGARQGRASARRATWGIIDQAVSSLTNFELTLLVARQADPRDFGTFSLAFVGYVFALWISRSLCTEPFVVRYTGEPSDVNREAAAGATGAALVMGVVGAVAIAPFALVAASGSHLLVVAIALSLPALLAQDAFRHVMFASGRPQAAALNDLLWLVLQTGGATILLATGDAGATELVAVFGGAALLAAVVGSAQTGVVPAPGHAWKWLARHRDLGIPFALELLTVTGTVQLALVGVAAVAGVVAVGELRAGMLLLAPLGVLFSGLFIFAVPEGVRLRARADSGFTTFVVGLGVSMPVASFLCGAALLLVPATAGEEVLGSNWTAARNLLGPVTALTAGTACALAAVIGLRALGAARASLGARLWGAPVTLLGGLGGAWAGGASGAGVGLAVAAWVDAAIAWGAFRRRASAPTGRSGAEDASARADDPPLVV